MTSISALRSALFGRAIPISKSVQFAVALGMIVLIAYPAQASAAEHWPRFRGPDGAGVVSGTTIPSKWAAEDYLWNVEIEGVGHSSPVVWGDRLFLNTATNDGRDRRLIAIDIATGASIWSVDLNLDSNHLHQKNSWASGSPAVDADVVCTTFADTEQFVVSAFDHDGELLWRQDVGPFDSKHGHGASPLLVGDLVIVTNDQLGPSATYAFSKFDGEVRWKLDRASGHTAYSTPLMIERNGRKQVVLSSSASGVTAVDVADGSEVWSTRGFRQRVVGSPILAGDFVIQTAGQGGGGKDFLAIDPYGKGDRKAGSIVKEMTRSLPYVPTPVYYDGKLFLWTDGGIIVCLDATDFRRLWIERLPGAAFSGSPVCIDGRLCAMSEDGTAYVVSASDRFELLGRTALGDPSYSTPAVANNKLFLRTFHRLMCLPGQD
ncbi:outer membrane protein assembly factor BamB family protein [Stratiformator vulcanicus]|uniref:Outer membrane biogenesis protein BamB n=1 Tax=Stratiformator vulcanicus TaxID=2527980 RepID=A0A517R6U1_9PLAN|nr:PQQ-binding-like beta-propeller repeat protein [Stratiformator vulcanicus]QDT39562.1 outer membrane biogenesis protein BamB [Stratiformator vulcanicus]